MALMVNVGEPSMRAGVSLREHVQDELDRHPGWWVPSVAVCLVWAFLRKRNRPAHR